MSASEQSAGMEIRSFHVVFRLERRLHRIDRWRLPFPHGVPIVAIGHAAAVLTAIVALGRLPGAGALIGVLPPPLVYVVIPCGAAAGLTRLRIDGRPAHRHLRGVAVAALTGRRTAAGRPAPLARDVVTETGLAAVGPGAAGYRPCVIAGPATVLIQRPARAHARARTVVLCGAPGAPLVPAKIVRLAEGHRLKVKRSR